MRFSRIVGRDHDELHALSPLGPTVGESQPPQGAQACKLEAGPWWCAMGKPEISAVTAAAGYNARGDGEMAYEMMACDNRRMLIHLLCPSSSQ